MKMIQCAYKHLKTTAITQDRALEKLNNKLTFGSDALTREDVVFTIVPIGTNPGVNRDENTI